jgi:hypothetical protein
MEGIGADINSGDAFDGSNLIAVAAGDQGKIIGLKAWLIVHKRLEY